MSVTWLTFHLNIILLGTSEFKKVKCKIDGSIKIYKAQLMAIHLK